MPIDFHLFDEQDRNQLAQFWNIYKLEKEIYCPEKKEFVNKKEGTKKCRYCGITASNGWKDAHLISNLLGNQTLFAADECTNCNILFSNMETHLAAFLGATRALNQVKGKKGIPKFKSADQKVVITGNQKWHGISTIGIERKHAGDDSIQIDQEKGICQVNVSKETYIPLKAYKSLIKIAYACLPENQLPYYQDVCDFLLTEKLDKALSHSCYVNKITYPYGIGVTKPFLWLCSKKDLMKQYPTHFALFFWTNYVFQYPLSYHQLDTTLFGGKPLKNIILPPFLLFKPTSNISIASSILNMSSTNPLKNERETITFKYEQNGKMSCYDPITQTIIEKPFDPNAIMGLKIATDPEFSLPVKSSSNNQNDLHT